MPLTVVIISPEGTLAPLEAEHVTLPAIDGEVGVRPMHAAMVCALGPGLLRIRPARGDERLFALRGGVAEVLADTLRILAEELREAATINPDGLAERIRALVADRGSAAAPRAEASEQARWLAAQLKAVGHEVPDLGRLGWVDM